MKDLGRDLVVEAWSEPDRIVEAIRWTRARRTCSPSSGTRSSTRPTIRSFIDDTPILDEFLAAAARHKAAAYAHLNQESR